MEISGNYLNPNIKLQSFKGVNLEQIPKAQPASPKEKGVIYGQDTCWKLYKPEVFEQFIKSDKELSEPLADILETARVYGLTPSIDMMQKFKQKRPEIDKFYEIVKAKYDIDLDVPPKVYRFVGKSEVEALKKDGMVKPQRGYWDKFDVTLNPDLNWNDYRITFKPKKEFDVTDKTGKMSENTGTGHDYFYFYEGPYTIDDVESVEQYRA